VYAKERVTITDANGKTSDPTNGGTVVNPKITDTNTTVVTPTNTNTNTTTNTTVNPTPTPTPTPTPSVDNVTPLLQAALPVAISQAAANNTAYTVSQGGYYYTKLGYTPNNSTYYFFQFGENGNAYNLDVTVTLKSYGQKCVTTESTEVDYSTQSDGTLWCTNECIIQPKINPSHTACSYLMNTSQNTAHWAWSLNSWTYA
jgi:hypothetical protein